MRIGHTVSPEPPEQVVRWLPGRGSWSRSHCHLCQFSFQVDEHERHRLGEASLGRMRVGSEPGISRTQCFIPPSSAYVPKEGTRNERKTQLNRQQNEGGAKDAAPDAHLDKLARVRDDWWREQHRRNEADQFSAEQHIL
jgi:hypothetical protein